MPSRPVTPVLRKVPPAPRRSRPAAGIDVESFGDVGVAPICTIPGTLRSLGVDPGPLVRNAGLDPRLFDNPMNRASIIPLGRLMGACAAATGMPHFGLVIGSQFVLPMLGVVGYLVRNESSVGAAMKTLVLNLRIQDRSAVAGLAEADERRVALTYGVCTPGTPATGIIDDTCIMIGCRILKSLCGPAWRPAEVHLAHARPVNSAVYREMLEAPVRYDMPLSMVLFERKWLAEPVRDADPVLLHVLQQLQSEVERHAVTRLTDQLRRVLRTGVMSGNADAAGIADLFSISERSLRRRLADEGTSLQALVAEARLLVAHQLLDESGMPVGEIAAVVGYADATAFSRAYRKWTGRSPREHRREP